MKVLRMSRSVIALGALSLMTAVASAEEMRETSAGESQQYTYTWRFADDDEMAPRGGTTKGPGVELDRSPSTAWARLQEPELTAQEKDRRAILAMAGPYRTTFDFIETTGFVPDYERKRPYRSWGTEYVYVIEDEPDFVSLQHIIVMFFIDDEGAVQGPSVVKHWRQDWRYEDTSIHSYVGDNTRQEHNYSAADVRGRWSQAVYQVDDSPRYEAIGRWQHSANFSSWVSDETWRPLPRREYSVRDDYDVLIGTNRHTITPTGWTHEELNQKVVLAEPGVLATELPILARESGFNRYERIVDHDFSAGDEYWRNTEAFWADVRVAWDALKTKNSRFQIAKSVDEQSMFMKMFAYAGEISAPDSYDSVDGRRHIDEVIEAFVTPVDSISAASVEQ